MSLYDSSQIRVTFVWIFSVSFRSLWKMNEHSWQWALRQRMLLPSFSNHPPIPATAPHWKKKERKFKKKNGGEESAHPSWVDNQPANQLLAHWLCHQAWILRKDPPLCCWCCCCLGSSLCICISVCLRCVCVRVCGSRMKWNARIGLPPRRTSPSYNVRQPAGTVGSGRSRIHQGTGPGGPGVIQREGRIFIYFFFLLKNSSILWTEGISGIRSNRSSVTFISSILFLSLSVVPHPFLLHPPPPLSFPPLILLEALAGISNLHVWQFVPTWIWRLGGGECSDACVCLLMRFCFLGMCLLAQLYTHTHTHAYTHGRPLMGLPTVHSSVIVGSARLEGGWVGGCWCVCVCVCVCEGCRQMASYASQSHSSVCVCVREYVRVMRAPVCIADIRLLICKERALEKPPGPFKRSSHSHWWAEPWSRRARWGRC